MPTDRKYLSFRRDIFVDNSALRRRDLVNCVAIVLRNLAAGIHAGAVGLHGTGGAAE